jgi:hypothetical protein
MCNPQFFIKKTITQGTLVATKANPKLQQRHQGRAFIPPVKKNEKKERRSKERMITYSSNFSPVGLALRVEHADSMLSVIEM